MNNDQKQKIVELRNAGVSYAKIGKLLGISGNTVKTYCRRNHVAIVQEPSSPTTLPIFCRECGAPLERAEKRKPKIFCSRECREKWWHAHPDKLNKKAVYDFQCAGCGKTFSAYGNRHRKYCSHECYIQARFKGGDCHE